MPNLTVILLLGLINTTEVTADTHWSLQPMTRTTIPNNSHPIDFFIEQKLEEKNLKISPPANRSNLLRRVSLDLTGLPPSPTEVKAFIDDPRDTKVIYAETVDRLLASPRYGERWAQHWLDVIRWAETVGFETNAERALAWPYRDWVITSLNSDMPYNRFILEQIIGDTVGADAALGFLVAGPANLAGQIGRDEEAMRSARQDELDEVIRTVSQSLLGLSIGCARCHDHKFDPILQRDYYGMQAVFAGLKYGERRHRGQQNNAWATQVEPAEKQLTKLHHQLEALRLKHGLRPALKTIHTEHFKPIQARSIRMKIKATGNGKPASLYEFEVWSTDQQNVALASTGAQASASSFALANQSRHFENLIDGLIDKRQSYPWVADKPGPAWIRVDLTQVTTIERVVWHRGSTMLADYEIEILPADGRAQVDWQRLVHTEDRLPRIDDTRSADKVNLRNLTLEQTRTLLTLIDSVRQQASKLAHLSAGPQVYAASFEAQPTPTWLLRRGDPMQRLEKIAPTIPALLGSMNLKSGVAEPHRRIELVKHLTNREHPLTTRVLVNRVWQHHFGVGLVSTPSDFGRMGATPSHPELLDWLALEFISQGWSLKKLHRLIVNSRTYRQSSRPRAQALRVDANTRLLWRFPPRRLEAEAIRDSILFVSAKLNLKMGGPGFDFFNQRGGLSDYTALETFEEEGWRRMIYAHKVRMQAVDIFSAFDCPDSGQMRPHRTRSITPLQSLSLMNSPFVNRQARFLAQRVRSEAGDDSKTQIDHAFALVCSRPPKWAEKKALLKLVKQHGLEQACRVLFNTSEFVFIQ